MDGSARRIRHFAVEVAEVVRETHDTVTLVLTPFAAAPRRDYRAGQFLTIDPHQLPALAGQVAVLEARKGRREPPRAYSVASTPAEPLAITVKEEPDGGAYPPLLSPYLVRRLGRGARLDVAGFSGAYTLPARLDDDVERVVHVCAGSGSVPDFAMLKAALADWPRLHQLFLYANKSWDDVIFRAPLDALAAAHRERLDVRHRLTRGDPPAGRADVARGRIDAALLTAAIGDPRRCLVYVCGPSLSRWDRAAARAAGVVPAPKFLEVMVAAARAAGVPPTRIHWESYA